MNAAGTVSPARTWTFGAYIDTDALAPGLYMKSPLDELAAHCLESVDPRFAGAVRPNDVICAGPGFGMGSSREQAAQALVSLGVAAVLAPSFGHIFYRNAFNNGLMVVICAEARSIPAGSQVSVDAVAGIVRDIDTDRSWECEPIPGHLLAMLADGGLVPHLEKRLRHGRLESECR